MQEQPAWAKALHIPKAQFDEWKMLAPTEESFTFWCLQSGRLAASKYFQWAKDHFEIALLDQKYFSLPANMDFWRQIHTVANWSPWLLPLEQWDGVIFIGCVEPPLETNWSFPVRYVLAQPADLEKLWQEYHGTSDSVVLGSLTVTQRFENTMANTKTLFNLKTAEEPGSDDENANPTSPSMVAPLGLNIDLSTFSERSQVTAAPAEESPLPPPLNLVAMPEISPATPEQPKSAAEPSAATPAVPTERKAPVRLSEPGPIDVSTAPESIDAATTPEMCLAWFFRQIRTKYATGMVLLQNKDGISVWKWESTLRRQAEKLPIVNFQTPSLFRVAARTLRPYHGFVVENPTHKTFFQAWGYSKLPPHVTAVPVVANGTFKGLFLCISTEPNLPVDTLNFVEKCLDRTVQRLEQTSNPFDSAA